MLCQLAENQKRLGQLEKNYQFGGLGIDSGNYFWDYIRVCTNGDNRKYGRLYGVCIIEIHRFYLWERGGTARRPLPLGRG